jgi:protein-arginine kinase activator protein McsA
MSEEFTETGTCVLCGAATPETGALNQYCDACLESSFGDADNTKTVVCSTCGKEFTARLGYFGLHDELCKDCKQQTMAQFEQMLMDYVSDVHALRKPKEGTMTNTQELIASKCDELKELLLEKNRKYGDSALNPIRVFSKANAMEQILVRMDDKLNRIKNRQNDEDEDVIKDLAGYLVLYMVAKDMNKQEK